MIVNINYLKEQERLKKETKMANGIPKKDGSGGGTRKNRGRGGCKKTRDTGKGQNNK